MRLGDMLSWVCTNPKGKHLPGEDWIVRDAHEERGATLVVEASQEDSVCRGRADIADRMELKRVQGEVLRRLGRPLREVASLEVNVPLK